MNHFRASHKTQGIRPKNPCLMKQTSGVCLQNTYDYSPFGISLDGRTMEGDFYRRGYNGMEKDNEILGLGNNYSTFFRQLDPRVGRWLSLDPKKESIPWQSPNCSMDNNPIKYIDPMGDDIYKVDRDGNISLKRKTNKDFDKIIGKNHSGFRISMKTDKGILSQKSSELHEVKLEQVGDDGNPMLIQRTFVTDSYSGDQKQVSNIFEFMAQATHVEWGIFNFGSNDNIWKTATLTTSHYGLGVFTHLNSSEYFLNSDFTGHDHIHPNNIKTPSGIYTGNSGDVLFAKTLIKKFSDKDLIFRIYTQDGQYTQYNDKLPK